MSMSPTTSTRGAIRPKDVATAATELARMKRSLRAWLKYRLLNDQVILGAYVGKLPTAQAAQIVSSHRNWRAEQDLATRLHALLADSYPELDLPDPVVSTNPQAAVQLARIALDPSVATSTSSPMPQGNWYTSWPLLIVAGVALVAVMGIRSYADVAKDQERIACIKAGACTDYGFWLKAVAVVVGGWFVWEKLGVGERVKRHVAGHGHKTLGPGRRL